MGALLQRVIDVQVHHEVVCPFFHIEILQQKDKLTEYKRPHIFIVAWTRKAEIFCRIVLRLRSPLQAQMGRCF